jgi:Icc-related predicted phosphoesterase
MRFALGSDIHLEFGELELKNTEGADVLVLSGDICIAKDLDFSESQRSENWMKFFEQVSTEFPHVIYIMGNHEHYHGDFAKSYGQLKTALAELHNIHVMEKESINFGDVTFVAGTLWTDMNKEDPTTLFGIKGYMNDYRIIEDSSNLVHYRDEEGKFHTRSGRFTPEKSVTEHKAMLQFIRDIVDHRPEHKFVVVGHHAPSKQSTKPKYEKEVMVNGAYSSDLSEFILDRPQIKVWTHGHTHDKYDYMLGSTRIVCNPRGYINYEDCADNFQLQYIDV